MAYQASRHRPLSFRHMNLPAFSGKFIVPRAVGDPSVSLNYSPAGSLTLWLSKYQPQRIAK